MRQTARRFQSARSWLAGGRFAPLPCSTSQASTLPGELTAVFALAASHSLGLRDRNARLGPPAFAATIQGQGAWS